MALSAPRPHRTPARDQRIVLGPRDLRILEAVHRHRFVTSHHVLSLEDGSRQQLVRRLRDLTDSGYLVRIRNPAPRAHNQGSPPRIHGISSRGADVLAAAGRVPRGAVNWDRRNGEVSDPKTGLGLKVVPHALFLTSVMVDIENCVRRRPDRVRLITAREILATLAPPETRVLRYPLAWHVETPYPRLVQASDGERYLHPEHCRVGVAPDQFFGLEFRLLPGDRNRFFYMLEVDRATSPVTPSAAANHAQFEKSSIYKKLLAYSATWLQGVHTKRFGIKSFQVLTITDGATHVSTMVKAFTLLRKKMASVWMGENTDALHRVFRFADRASATPGRLLRYEWYDGTGARKPLSTLFDDL